MSKELLPIQFQLNEDQNEIYSIHIPDHLKSLYNYLANNPQSQFIKESLQEYKFLTMTKEQKAQHAHKQTLVLSLSIILQVKKS